MHLGLQEWLLLEYTKEGDTVLDPMAGSGTALIGTLMGRHIFCVELETKFIKMAEDNLKKLSQMPLYLGTKERGQAVIIQGDARNLTGLLADKVLFSPPYAGAKQVLDTKFFAKALKDLEGRDVASEDAGLRTGEDSPENISNLPYGQIDHIVTSPPYGSDERYGRTLTENSIGGREPRMNMVYGQVDKIVSSPPYSSSRLDPLQPEYSDPTKLLYRGSQPEGYGSNPDNIGNLVHGNINHILKQDDRMSIDCGEALFELPSQRVQSNAVALFSGIQIGKLKQDFSVLFLDFKEWNDLRQEIFEAIIPSYNTAENMLASLARVCPSGISKLREMCRNPNNCLLITHRDFNMRSQGGVPRAIPAILLSRDIKATFSVKQPSQVSQINSIHTNKHNIKQGVCQLPHGNISAIISSPPYEGTEARDRSKESWWDEEREKKMSGGSAKIAKGYQADHIITSPPYEETMGEKHHSPRADKLAGEKSNPTTYTEKVDCVLTSPPYEGIMQGKSDEDRAKEFEKLTKAGIKVNPNSKSSNLVKGTEYSKDNENIGNLKSTSYLEAMALVYAQCYAVLRPGGLLLLVTKNFIRDQKEIRLDEDTIALCEQAGFLLQERHFRRLTQQSFWRTIYRHKFPDAPVLDKEDIMIFEKPTRLE